MELIIRISRLVQVIMFPNVCGLRRNRKPCLVRRNDAICEAHARSPERPLRSMGLYSHSASKRQPRLCPSSQSLDISDYVGGVLGLRVAHSLEGEVLRSRAR